MTTNADARGRGTEGPGSPVIPQHPPPGIVRAVAWLVLGLVVCATIGAFQVRLPHAVERPFVLVPSVEPDALRAPTRAVVEAARVRAGQEVAAQAELFVLRAEPSPGGSGPAAPGDRLVVRAPHRGVVLAVGDLGAGSTVEAGQELCRFLDADVPLRALLTLEDADLGQATPGRRVRLSVDALPSTHPASLDGRLEWVSGAAVPSATGTSFVGLASLGSGSIDAGAAPGPLRVGMKGIARIVLGHRSVVDILFGPATAER